MRIAGYSSEGESIFLQIEGSMIYEEISAVN